MGNVRQHVFGSAIRPAKPEQPFQLRMTRMARMGEGFWIGCSPGRRPGKNLTAASRQGRQGRGEAFAGSPAAWRPLRSLREKLSENSGIGAGNRGLIPKKSDFGSFVARSVDPGRIWQPSLAKDAKDAEKLSQDRQPLGALCVLCERILRKRPVFRPEIAIFYRKTVPNGPKTAFSDPFSPARPVAARFRSENRLSPRTPRSRRSFG